MRACLTCSPTTHIARMALLTHRVHNGGNRAAPYSASFLWVLVRCSMYGKPGEVGFCWAACWMAPGSERPHAIVSVRTSSHTRAYLYRTQ